MKLRRLASIVLLVACVLVQTTRAQEPLAAFPEDTALVARIASIDKLTGGFNELIGGLGPLAAIAGPQFEVGLAQALQLGTTIEGVDRTVPAYVAVFPLEGEQQPVAFLVKATDEARLQRSVLRAAADEALTPEPLDEGFVKLTKNDRTWFFGHHGEAVLYTGNAKVQQLLAVGRRAEKTFAGLVEPRAAQLLEAGDGAVLVNVARLTELYGEQLKQAREQAARQIEGLPDDMLGGSNAPAAKRLYLQLANLVFDGVSDAKWAGGRVNVNAAGVNLTVALGVKQGSASEQLFASNPPTSFENLGLLPAGAPVYFGSFLNSEKAAALTRGYLQGADEAKTKELEAALDEASQAGAGASAGSFTLPPDAKSGMIATTLSQAEKPDVLRASNRKIKAAVGEVKTPVFTQSYEYLEAAETYKDRPVDVQTMKVEMAKTDDAGLQIAQQFIQRFFGGDALQTRVTTLEGLLLETSGNDPKYIQRVVDGLGSGEGVLGLDEAYAKTRDQLADEANLVAMFNVPQLIVDFVKIAREVPLLNMFIAQAPFNFGAQPAVSYGGISLGTEPQGLRLQIFIPIEQPKGVMQIFGQGF